MTALNEGTWQYGGMQGHKAFYYVHVAGYGGGGLEISQPMIAYGGCQADGWRWWIGVANGFWCCDAATSHLIPEFWFCLPSCPFFHSCHLRWCQGFQIVGWSHLQKGAIWLSQEVWLHRLPKGVGKVSLILTAMNMSAYGLTTEHITGLVGLAAKRERNLLYSSSIGGGITWLDVASLTDFLGWLLHLISEIWAGCTFFNSGGITQYAFLSVTRSDSLIRTPASIAHSSDAAWEHVSSRPAMQLQCAVTIFPKHSARIHGIRGFSFKRCKWLTNVLAKRQTRDYL